MRDGIPNYSDMSIIVVGSAEAPVQDPEGETRYCCSGDSVFVVMCKESRSLSASLEVGPKVVGVLPTSS